MSHRKALRGMDPEEAFARLGGLTEAYMRLRFEGLLGGIADPLPQLDKLCESPDPRLARAAQDLHSNLGWLRHWFQPCTDAQLVHIADLTTRALNREFNKSPEEQLFKLVVLDVGTIRARYIIDQIEKRNTLAAPKKPLGKRTLVRRARALVRSQSARDR